MNNYPGKFIVIYGINNLGKSTQAKILLNNILALGQKAEYLKYPIYDLTPTGPAINNILRGGRQQEISELELQQLYATNRHDYEPTLISKLASGIHIVSEDYVGTGLAWGVTKGADLAVLEKQNEGLVGEDFVILLDGDRFLEGKENNHLHEKDDELMNRCRLVHLQLAKKYNWRIVNANADAKNVADKIWKLAKEVIES
ncbi:MAG: hypothetical protein PHW95_05305 [Patescibacteria group bacterium]|nr:hypothetical protein [Patescibacteria group bacterium]